jgi:MYXO-CTERM domain-containing protein
MRKMIELPSAVSVLSAALLAAAPVHATEYQIVPLNTSPFGGGQANAVYRGQVGGGVFTGAAYWPTPTTRIDFDPNRNFRGSGIDGMWGTQRVGGVSLQDGSTHATLWTGTAASRVDLNPGGTGLSSGGSMLLGTDGVEQVGTANAAAALWSGTAASYVKLDRFNAYPLSYARGVWAGTQVGYSTTAGGGIIDALEWHGTSESMTVLRQGSAAYGISRGQVVGLTQLNAKTVQDAVIWADGTAGSFQDLAPAGTTASELWATNGTQQAGDISTFPGLPGGLPVDHKPAVWRGTAWSMQPLPLPAGSNGGYAYAIDGDGNIAGVVGHDANGSIGQQIAVLWVPNRVAGDINFDGIVNFSDLLVLAQGYGRMGEWVDGDLNMDGTVGFDDLLILAQDYGKMSAAPAVAPVPEPGVFAFAMLVGAVAVRRRRRA